MQIILFLLTLYLIGCVLYGIASGVQSIQHGFSRLSNSRKDDEGPAAKAAPATPPSAEPDNANESCPEASPLQQNIAALRELFALFQQGALTEQEFQSIKRRLLADTQSPPESPKNF